MRKCPADWVRVSVILHWVQGVIKRRLIFNWQQSQRCSRQQSLEKNCSPSHLTLGNRRLNRWKARGSSCTRAPRRCSSWGEWRWHWRGEASEPFDNATRWPCGTQSWRPWTEWTGQTSVLKSLQCWWDSKLSEDKFWLCRVWERERREREGYIYIKRERKCTCVWQSVY